MTKFDSEKTTKESKPQTIAEFISWGKTLGSDWQASGLTALYGLNVAAAVNNVQASSVWRELTKLLESVEQQYAIDTGAKLFLDQVPDPNIDKKEFGSVIDKAFRSNVLWNKRWPQQPDGGWVTPENCYSRLDDLVRTTIVCTFLDGPEVISTALKKFCESHKVPVSIRKLNRNEGYYAHHAYLAFPMELARLAGGVSAQDVRLEIQVSTQAQHLLKQLTHHYYKKERSQPRKNRDEWQWEFRTNRFRARYLSHALHLLEGLIVDVRDRPDHDDDDKQE